MRRLRLFAIVFAAAVILFSSAVLWIGMRQQQLDRERMEAARDRDSNVFYEIFVRAFHDSDGDGKGDLNGIVAKLDYLREMGVSGIWMTPIHPSPSYHGYDVTDYYAIHPDFGTMEDFERLIEEAHRRNIKIIMDLVVNHTSNRHPWFVEARSGADNPKRDWYIWADEATNVNATSAIGGKAWHSVSTGRYLGIFGEGMPDLNLDNPEVREAIIRIARFWLEKGVDGFRLDAAKHVYEDLQGDNRRPEVAEKNVAWWREFRAALEEVKPDVYLVGEVWDAPSVIGPYLDGAFDSGFNFELAGKLIQLAKSERATDIAAAVRRIHDYYAEVSGGRFIDATFLSNHDQNRVMSQLEGNVDHAKMAAALLLTLPGRVFLYYGEEIGMEGVKPDENLRRPMPWDEVDRQHNEPDSLLNHYRRLVNWRKLEPALAFGTVESYATGHRSVVSYIREHEGERLLVLHNLSGEPQQLALESKADIEAEKLAVTLASAPGIKFERDEVSLPAYSTAVLKAK
jgi:glycosidase